MYNKGLIVLKDKNVLFIIGSLIGLLLFDRTFVYMLMGILIICILINKITKRKEVYYFDITLVTLYMLFILFTINIDIYRINPIIVAYGSLVLCKLI